MEALQVLLVQKYVSCQGKYFEPKSVLIHLEFDKFVGFFSLYKTASASLLVNVLNFIKLNNNKK